MTAELDRFPIKELPQRWGVSRSVVYTRLEKLSIKPTKEKNQSFISFEDLKLLDRLDSHLKNGGTTGDFTDQPDRQDKQDKLPSHKDSSNQTDTLDRQDGQTRQLVIPDLLEQIITVTLDAIETRKTGLNDLRDLEEIATKKWLIPSKRLAEIVGRSRSFLSGKKSLNYCGFILEKVGKQGNETLWKITKQET